MDHTHNVIKCYLTLIQWWDRSKVTKLAINIVICNDTQATKSSLSVPRTSSRCETHRRVNLRGLSVCTITTALTLRCETFDTQSILAIRELKVLVFGIQRNRRTGKFSSRPSVDICLEAEVHTGNGKQNQQDFGRVSLITQKQRRHLFVKYNH